MPNHAMTPHVSGTTLEAQKRYADGEIQSGSYKAIYG